jgi:hypothetical protein
VTGVATELPLAGVVTVIIPFEVEAAAYDASSTIGTMNFMSPPPVRLMESWSHARFQTSEFSVPTLSKWNDKEELSV